MQYFPGVIPTSIDIAWLQGELRKIAEAFEQGSDRSRIVPTTAAPSKTVEGEVRVADGVGWNPGRGAGTYVFRGGTWQLIEAGFNSDLQSFRFFLGE